MSFFNLNANLKEASFLQFYWREGKNQLEAEDGEYSIE